MPLNIRAPHSLAITGVIWGTTKQVERILQPDFRATCSFEPILLPFTIFFLGGGGGSFGTVERMFRFLG